MAGVTILERPTCADFRYSESAALPITTTPLDHNNSDVKKPHITVEVILKMAGVTILELPTRADFRYSESAALPITTTPLDHNNTNVKKPRHYCRGFLEDGRNYDTRTPNTR